MLDQKLSIQIKNLWSAISFLKWGLLLKGQLKFRFGCDHT